MGNLDAFVFLNYVFVRLSFPFGGVLRNPAFVLIRVVERTNYLKMLDLIMEYFHIVGGKSM